MAISRIPEGLVPCPNCNRVTTAEAGYCTHCGAPLFTVAEEAPGYEWNLYLGHTPEGAKMGLASRDVARHIVIYGNVGSGKTTMVKRLLFEASKMNIGFLVLDWSGEYTDLARVTGAKLLQGPGSPNPLRVDLFNPKNMDEMVYSTIVTNILVRTIQDSGWQLTPQMESVLDRAVRKAVRRRAPASRLPELIEEAAQGTPQGRMTAAALEARLHPVIYGLSSTVYQGPDSPERLLGERIVIDLSWLSSASPRDAWMTGQLLINRFYAEASKAPITTNLRHILVVEEAEELAPSRCTSSTYTGLASAMVQFRRRGIGVVIVAHSPSLIDPGVARIPGNVAVFRVSHADDAREAAGSLGSRALEGEVQSLDVGELLLKPSSSPTHYRVRVDPVDGVSWEDEARILESISLYPHLTQRERRELVRMSSYKYSSTVKNLIEAGIVEIVSVNTGKGRPVRLLQIRGQNPGAAHAFLEHRALAVLSGMGIKARRAARDGPDIQAAVGGRLLCIEIETGSNVNLGKYTRFLEVCDALIIVCSSRACLGKASRLQHQIGDGRARVVLLRSLHSAVEKAISGWIGQRAL